MKRSRAFILAEILMTIMLQAGFILTLCTSFYLLLSFYSKTQQVLVARNHAERVISFMDDKIRHAGLGLWKCKTPEKIGTRLGNISMLSWISNGNKGYKLPISLKWHRDGVPYNVEDIPLKSVDQNSGDVLTVLYAQRDLSTGKDYEIISAFSAPVSLEPEPYNATRLTTKKNVPLLDSSSASLLKNNPTFSIGGGEGNIKSYAVMEGVGVPMYLQSLPTSGANKEKLTVKVFKDSTENLDIILPPGGELLGLECMQMFVDHRITGEGGQLVYRTLKSDGTGWDKNYNQEKGILDLYMKLDTKNKTFTLWVLATGGYDADAKLTLHRPDAWPKEANPQGSSDDEAQEEWLNSDYCHHIVYVSRKSWKLNNIPSDSSGTD